MYVWTQQVFNPSLSTCVMQITSTTLFRHKKHTHSKRWFLNQLSAVLFIPETHLLMSVLHFSFTEINDSTNLIRKSSIVNITQVVKCPSVLLLRSWLYLSIASYRSSPNHLSKIWVINRNNKLFIFLRSTVAPTLSYAWITSVKLLTYKNYKYISSSLLPFQFVIISLW